MTTKEIIKNARERLGVKQLTPMQAKMASLPPKGSEALALIAPTGSGKTLAFALAMLPSIQEGRDHVQAVVVVPSRELALQISKVLTALAPGLKQAVVYGGHSMLDETRSLQRSTPAVVVGTPGRLLDHMGRGNLNLGRATTLVLDEYDKSLELGFQDEMRRLVRAMRSVKRLLLTSATPLGELPDFLAHRPLEVLDFHEKGSEVQPDLTFRNVPSAEADKLPVLLDLLKRLPHERTIVFVNHRESAERVFDFLKKQGLPVTLYHGALEQPDRETAVELLANGSAPIMVATDLAARGLDIPAVRSVVHYHLPLQQEVWTHRNGRAARMGASGDVYAIVGPKETSPVPDAPTGMPDREPQPWKAERVTLRFNAGRKDKLGKGDIVGALTQVAGLPGDAVGTIALHDHRALVDIPASWAPQALKALNEGKIKGHKIRVTQLA